MTRAMTASLCCVIAWASSAFAQEPIPHPYFPLKVGHHWTYRVTDLKAPAGQADSKRSTEIKVERTQIYTEKIKDKEKGMETTKDYMGFILKNGSDNKFTRDHVVVLPTGVYRIHVAETPITPPMLFFKFGAKAGETWTLDSVSANKNVKGTFTGKADKVTVPYSKTPLDVWMISFHNNMQGDDRIEVDTWFAPDIGMVKLRRKGQNQEVLLELEKFDKAK
jgi:hypothetical protein